jgi:hypothetical protein
MEGESACEVVSSNRELGLECIDIDGELIRDDMVRVGVPNSSNLQQRERWRKSGKNFDSQNLKMAGGSESCSGLH